MKKVFLCGTYLKGEHTLYVSLWNSFDTANLKYDSTPEILFVCLPMWTL